MLPDEKLTNILKSLKQAQKIRGAITPSDSWQAAVMSDVQRAAREGEHYSFDNVCWRLAFAALLLSLVLHAGYKISNLETAISDNGIIQLDPFNIWSDHYG